MYIGEYGLTVLRLFTSVFMLATAVVMVAFIIRIFKPELKTMKYAALISMALFTALCLCGIDRTVAAYNVNAYLDGKLPTIDVDTLYFLSDSAIPYVAKLTECDNETVRKDASNIVIDMYEDYIGYRGDYSDDANGAYRTDFVLAGTDYTVSIHLAAKAIDSREIKYYSPYEINDNKDYSDQHSQIIEDEDLLFDDETLTWE